MGGTTTESLAHSSRWQAELRLEAVGDINGTFLVPAYQRGYRWGEGEVRLLLEDIWAVDRGNYCLQPIVVKRLADGACELIDGQQRLTTLYLIFQHMQRAGLKGLGAPFSIQYETRARSAEFLANIDERRKDENIDFAYMYGAYRCISEWFEGHGRRKQLAADRIYGRLFEQVKVIWYEVAQEVESTALFTRLNVGRIPLTNAELVKALLLRRLGTEGADKAHQRRQIEIATQWDLIERDLHAEAFWAFLTNRQVQEYPTRIEFIFELLAGRAPKGESFHTFLHFKAELERGVPPDGLWSQVLARHALLKEWYEDRDLYHKIGYLVATGAPEGDEIAGLLRESEVLTKSQLHKLLDGKIRRRLDLSREDLTELSYDSGYEACARVLLLFNVETVRALRHSEERYPFHAHKSERWSLEHIHAQNAEALNKKEQWQAWLGAHRECLRELTLPAPERAQRDAFIAEIDASWADINKESFAKLSEKITRFFSDAEALDGLHSIDNLALLSSGANSALSNSVFEVKRRRILEKDRAGEYIPICTRRVFLKYYTHASDQQVQLWSRQDREAYREAMFAEEQGVLSRYLKPLSTEAP